MSSGTNTCTSKQTNTVFKYFKFDLLSYVLSNNYAIQL